MMFSLEGMTALVTGASGGLGSAIAKALAAEMPTRVKVSWALLTRRSPSRLAKAIAADAPQMATAPPASTQVIQVQFGCWRRSVGDPGLKMCIPSSVRSIGMWE